MNADRVFVVDSCPDVEPQTEEKENLVMACPLCGTPVLHSCYHEDKGDVRSVEMPVAGAIGLMDNHIEHLIELTDAAKEHRQQLLACMMDWDV